MTDVLNLNFVTEESEHAMVSRTFYRRCGSATQLQRSNRSLIVTVRRCVFVVPLRREITLE